MKNAIFILVECDNANINYRETIPFVKKLCNEYFGNKHFNSGFDHDPICFTDEVITNEDISNIYELIGDNSSIRLFGINNFVGTNLKVNNIFTFPPNEKLTQSF